MKKILGNNPETWYAPCQIDQTINKAVEAEPPWLGSKRTTRSARRRWPPS